MMVLNNILPRVRRSDEPWALVENRFLRRSPFGGSKNQSKGVNPTDKYEIHYLAAVLIAAIKFLLIFEGDTFSITIFSHSLNAENKRNFSANFGRNSSNALKPDSNTKLRMNRVFFLRSALGSNLPINSSPHKIGKTK